MKIVAKRRRRESKTNYTKRKRLLENARPRVIIRKSNKFITIQYIESRVAQDKVVHSINSKISYAFYAKLKDQLDRVKKGVHLNISFSYRLFLPITIIVLIFSKEIVLLVYGEKWIEVAVYFKYLAGLFILSPLFAILKFFLISHNGIDEVFKSRIYSLIALILGIFFIYHFSLDFKYIALLLSIIFFFSFIYLIVFTNKKLKIDLKGLFLKPSFIAVLLTPVLLIPNLHWMIISWFYLLLYLSYES